MKTEKLEKTVIYVGAACFYATLVSLLCAALTGCGHNAVQYSDGVGLEVGFVPDQYTLALNFRYGKIFSAVVKEKTQIELKTEAANNASAQSDAKTQTGVITSLTMQTGDQVTGYVVDLERVKAGGK